MHDGRLRANVLRKTAPLVAGRAELQAKLSKLSKSAELSSSFLKSVKLPTGVFKATELRRSMELPSSFLKSVKLPTEVFKATELRTSFLNLAELRKSMELSSSFLKSVKLPTEALKSMELRTATPPWRRRAAAIRIGTINAVRALLTLVMRCFVRAGGAWNNTCPDRRPAERIVECVGWWIPKRHREFVVGDLVEIEIPAMRKEGLR